MLDDPQDKDKDWDVIYFQPGQVVFHVTGDATEESNKKLLMWANTLAESKGLQISNPRIQKFPPTPPQSQDVQRGAHPAEKSSKENSQTRTPIGERGPFALVYADVPKLKNDDNLSNPELDLQLLDLIFLLDKERKGSLGDSVQVVSPNWLTSGSSRPGGTGGPGGKPTPYKGSSDNKEYKFYFPESSTQQFLAHLERGTGEGVVVAILDTAPDPNELDEIFKEWVIRDGRNHPLISTLLDPKKPRLIVHDDPRVKIAPLSELKCIDYDYNMNDHGLFVAGIIHSLALQAELHLFQVLNRYGVGNLEIIGNALEKVIHEFEDRHLVVNLSLNLNIPLEKAHTKVGRKNILDDIGQQILSYKSSQPGDEPWLKRVAGLPEWICDLVYALGSRVIAAAGNDRKLSDLGSVRPQARYPAAFDRVVGVGALPRTKTRPSPAAQLVTASYSNLSDRPAKSGITTLGGEAGPYEGVLGIYVEEFPDGAPSNNGWAWWCGTSFATPIISGLTAAVLSSILSTGQRATTQQAIDELYAAQAIETLANEDVLFVTQGAPPPPA